MTRFTRLRAALVTSLVGLTLALPGLHLAPLATLPAAHAAPTSGDVVASPLHGYWKNIDPHTNTIPYLRIGAVDGGLRLDIWGVCHPTACYWGPQTLSPGEGPANGGVIYHFGYADRVVKLFLRRDGLHVQTHTHFLDGSGRADYDRSEIFKRSTPALWQS